MNTKTCTGCQQNFPITDEDRAFYKRMDVPEPGQCPQCRSRKRLAFRNERTLYKRKCDLCEKTMISIYSEDKPYPAYCQDCFWGDGWDPKKHARDFDFERPFFEQLHELMNVVPRLGIINKQSENSDYCNYSFANKNCYLTFGNHYEEDCMYGHYSTKNKDCLDYLYLYESELCYQCMFSGNCYGCVYLSHCEGCNDCYFSADLKECEHCLFCSNLRHKKYCILNEQYSEEEYLKKLEEYGLSYPAKFAKAEKFFTEELILKFPHRAVYQTNCQNCMGSNLQNSKSLRYCFDCTGCEDCAYGFQMDETYDSMDMNCMGYDKSELCYQTIGCSGIFNCITCDSCWHNNDLAYCNLCFSSKNLFGCVGMNRAEYCILNKQYSREEYEALLPRIIEHMKKIGEWGEFFPAEISPFEYRETVANEYFPSGTCAKQATQQDAVAGAVQCSACQGNFKIIPQESKFYEKLNLPKPQKCPDCRHKARLALRNPRALWQRTCNKCGKAVWTTYSPDRPETVYCEACYLADVY